MQDSRRVRGNTHDATPATKRDLRKAILYVVKVWLDRLQLVSAITTFFASIDALLFSLASGATHIDNSTVHIWSRTDELTSACLAGALIFHICAAIVAFIGSFVLCRLELESAEAQEERLLDEETGGVDVRRTVTTTSQQATDTKHRLSASESPTLEEKQTPADPMQIGAFLEEEIRRKLLGRVVVRRAHPLDAFNGFTRRRPQERNASIATDTQHHRSGRFRTQELPIQMLARCLTLSVGMAMLGFALGTLGVLAYAWAVTPHSVSIFSTACLGGCLVAAAVAVVVP
ncbi:hypothetical protein WOLCODRAFT_166981 [Wolfiporia cocos MD-104 SS10]|uniref:Transmembrane protein n=1 Tax=Wolfiporia cocos (strain MD-104) TaxID=742152 RepID=A0A2H3J2S5_WOLCO|nr:hypothetical protein WOLCODRAFT_166981 [Wolfiporia cocos MD-104 SS10]